MEYLCFIKKHWKEILLILLLVGFVLRSKHEANQLRLAHSATEAALQEEIEMLKSIHADEIEQREKALKEYKERLKILEREYEEAQQEIIRLRQEQKEEYIRDFSQDKDALAEAIMIRYGFTYVP